MAKKMRIVHTQQATEVILSFDIQTGKLGIQADNEMARFHNLLHFGLSQEEATELCVALQQYAESPN